MANDPAPRIQITQLSSATSTVVYGNLLSLPFGGGMLYVQPLYVKSTNVDQPLPLLKKVLVSYGDQVGYADTLPRRSSSWSTRAATATHHRHAAHTGDRRPRAAATTGQPPVTGDLAAAAAKIQARSTRWRRRSGQGDPRRGARRSRT
jgi:uncharacterized membrane protein (UPF0182 family)